VYCGVTGAECESAQGRESHADAPPAGSGTFYARQEYTVLGSNVNLAARLMGEAKPGQVCCCEHTATSCREQFTFDEQEPAVLKVSGLEV
jgi:class 3 adenylate cyclase